MLAIVVAAWLPSAANGQLYVGADVGVAILGNLESTRTNVGVPTNCDQFLAPATLNDGTAVPLPLDQCGPRPLPASPSGFDVNAGWLAGGQVGYAMTPFRIEGEIVHRRHGGDDVDLVVPGDPKQAEFVQRREKISNVRGTGLFANVYYDFGAARTTRRLTPYIGVGLGLMRLDMNYAARSVRTSDRATLLNLGRNPDAAGRLSATSESLSDDLFGYQLLAGLDYALGARSSLTLKLRYGDTFGAFEDGDKAWDLLRDHASTVGPSGAPVRYDIKATDLDFWALSLGVKFFLH